MIKVALVSFQNSTTALGLGYLISWFQKYSAYKNQVEFKIVALPRVTSTVIVSMDKVCTQLENFDIVGISTITQDYNEIMELSNLLGKRGVRIILGGHHISALPQTLPISAKAGVLGEGEITFQKLLELFIEKGEFLEQELGFIEGVCYRGADGQVKINKVRERIQNIDIIPIPDRSYYSADCFQPMIKFKNKVTGAIITSRGCPFCCVFCSSSRHWQNQIRLFSPEYVFNEILYLYNDYKVTLFQIYDDLGTISKIRWKRIRNLLKKNGMLGKIEFHAQCRVDIFDEEMCSLFKELNFTELEFGIESGSQNILDYLKNARRIGRGCTVEQNFRAIKMSLEAGIKVWAQLIIGAPEETIEDVKKTLRFTEIQGVRYQIYLLTPLPGTDLWEYAHKRGLVSDKMDWNKLHLEVNEKTFFNKIHLCEKIPKEKLWNLIKNKFDENFIREEIKGMSFTFRTFYLALKMLKKDPKVFSISYVNKIRSILKYFYSRGRNFIYRNNQRIGEVIKHLVKDFIVIFLFFLSRFSNFILKKPKGYAILMYHRVVTDEEWGLLLNPSIGVRLGDFQEQIKFIKENCQVISLSEMIKKISNKEKPDSLYVTVTFDDGYADNYILGRAVMQKYGVKATIFISTEYVEKRDKLPYWDEIIEHVKSTDGEIILSDPNGREHYFRLNSLREKRNFIAVIFKWIYQDPELTKKLFCQIKSKEVVKCQGKNIFFSWDLLKEALNSGNFEIGSHTLTHPVLGILPDFGKEEIECSKKILEEKLNISIDYFSYPHGGSNVLLPEVITSVRHAKYQAAVTNNIGINKEDAQFFLLKRIPILGGESIYIFKTKIYLANLIGFLQKIKTKL